jgi:transcriptional regulator with XRE-family HTH domain
MADAFGPKFSRLRHALGLSQLDMANALGVSAAYANDVEHDRRGPTVRLVKAICKLINADQDVAERWHRHGARAKGWDV